VARRWFTITKLAKCMTDDMPEPSPAKIQALLKDKKELKRIRRRLSSVSWFMGVLCENIARRANRQDGCSGHFWESRFGCRECTDAGAVLLCGIYLDLNPIKAGEAAGPETARFTSAYSRIQASKQRKNARDRADGWMAELTTRPENQADEHLAYSSRSRRRASDLGVLPISLEAYVALLKWTAQSILSGARETIPQDLETVLDHLHVNEEAWLDTVQDYQSAFCRVVGTPASLAKAAQRMNVRCLRGATACRRLFG